MTDEEMERFREKVRAVTTRDSGEGYVWWQYTATDGSTRGGWVGLMNVAELDRAETTFHTRYQPSA